MPGNWPVHKSRKPNKSRRRTMTCIERIQVSARRCVFVYMHSEKKKKGKAHKFAHPFHGPFRVIELTANDTKVVPVDKPHSSPIFVALDQVRHCPDELPP